MRLEERLREKHREVLALAAKHGAKNIRVFGSVVRGEATETSDVDLLVEAGPQTSPWFPAGLVLDLEQLLGCHVDVITEGALHWYIRDKILKEAEAL